MKHIFDVEIAKKYGIVEAVLLENFGFWIRHNIANKTNYHDGRYWTFNSRKAFCELFPYMTEDKIRYAVDKLIAKGLIIKGNYNKKKMDRTIWYALTDEGLKLCEIPQCICENSQMDLGKPPNATVEIPRAIPYINTDINKDTTTMVGVNAQADFLSKLVGFWDSNFHPVTPHEVELIRGLLDDVGYSNVIQAMEIAVSNNRRNFGYVKSTADNLANGIDFREKNKPKEEPTEEYHTVLTDKEKAFYEKWKAKHGESNGQ